MQRLPNVNVANTSLYPNGQGVFGIGAATEGSKPLFYNESPYNLQLDFYNGKTDTLHAWEANYWTVDGDTKEVGWLIDPDSPQQTSPPSTVVYITLYDASEKLEGTYPHSITRQVNTGNPGGISANVTQLVNTGNPAGTNVITISDSTGSTLTLDNDGVLALYTLISGVLVSQIQTQKVGNPLLLGALNKLVEIIGGLTIDQSLTVTGDITSGSNIIHHVNAIDASDGNNWVAVTPGSVTRIANPASVVIQAPGGSTRVTVTSTSMSSGVNFDAPNITLDSGVLSLLFGNISKINFINGSGTGTYNHGLSSVPTWVIPMVNVLGSATLGQDSITSTNVHITIGAALGFRALALL